MVIKKVWYNNNNEKEKEKEYMICLLFKPVVHTLEDFEVGLSDKMITIIIVI